MLKPSLEEVKALAKQYNTIPVFYEFSADNQTPLNERQPEFIYSGKRQQRCAVGPVFVCWRFTERGDLHYR